MIPTDKDLAGFLSALAVHHPAAEYGPVVRDDGTVCHVFDTLPDETGSCLFLALAPTGDGQWTMTDCNTEEVLATSLSPREAGEAGIARHIIAQETARAGLPETQEPLLVCRSYRGRKEAKDLVAASG